MAKRRSSTPIWERAAPPDSRHHSLSPKKKAAAKARAKRAGRPYPNLVDNVRASGANTKAKPKKQGGKPAGRSR